MRSGATHVAESLGFERSSKKRNLPGDARPIDDGTAMFAKDFPRIPRNRGNRIRESRVAVLNRTIGLQSTLDSTTTVLRRG